MIKKANNKLVLEIPYIHASHMTQKADSNNLIISILSDDGKTIVRFLNTSIQDTRNQITENIFSLN